MRTELTRGLLFTLVTMVLFGGVYHGVVWGIGRLVFPAQAEGSLIRDDGGRVVGSRLIAQAFTRDEYFHPRPSAVDYNAASAGGSNFGPSNPEYLDAVRQRLADVAKREGVAPDQVPSEMITASGGGLDPHISPEAAELQAPRVARARKLSVEQVGALIRSHIESPAFGLIGRHRVNVLELNLALDQ